jgi:hypothetical protein
MCAQLFIMDFNALGALQGYLSRLPSPLAGKVRPHGAPVGTRSELLSVFAFPAHRHKKVRTTNVIERCFVEVRRRTRPMVCFVNLASVDRILYSIFLRFNLEWKTRKTQACFAPFRRPCS